MNDIKLSRSHKIGSLCIYTAFQILKENGGELSGRDLMKEVGNRVELDEWAKEGYERTGHTRWQSIFHFHSIRHVKSGFLIKKKGVWYLTPEGETALELGEIGLYRVAKEAFVKWKIERKTEEEVESADTEDVEVSEQDQTLSIDQAEQIAMEGLKSYILSKNPYEFQELAAALLHGMGYFTPFVSPRGKDGGLDIRLWIRFASRKRIRINRYLIQQMNLNDT